MIKVIRELIAKFAMKKGIILPFLLLLASVVFTTGAFFILDNKQKITSQKQTQSASPSPTGETADWQTFTNNKAKYLVKFPKDWFVIRKSDYVVEISDRPIDEKTTDRKISIEIINAYHLEGFNFDELYENPNGSVVSGPISKWTKIKNISIDQARAIFYTHNLIFSEEKAGFQATVWIEEKLPEAPITIWVKSLSPEQFDQDFKNIYLPIFNQILSTFKFLDQPEEAKFCGGIAGIVCPSDYKCSLDGNYPDAGGKCVKE